ncbi:DUF1217 domain-containing protein [Cereibacter azotoformans]|uniref:Uncharacterized protein DUF1217 n=1 Tax=Cereibacter azotoformans TaxID=43057 RepID=A0A2T5JW75_9RHOB|nr:DUF1217 domain-containing protein [Cereibacter azotoformans]PTR14318.1 uncharacterized protein DUF1217 [Cereibacter azotoformans]
MSVQPVLPLSGYAGWRFLERTMERQREVHDQSQQVRKDVAYFAEKIGTVRTAEDLVSDYRLLKVALGAFGLEEAIDGKALVRKVLTDGSGDKGALANRLSDKRWLALTKAFGFEAGGAGTTAEGFADRIAAQYRARSFESAVGELDGNMGLALTLDREMASLAADDTSESAKWYSVLGSTSMRAVFDGAFGLPKAFAALDLDRQLAVYRDKAEAMFGRNSVSQFADPEVRDKLIKTFLIRAELGTPAGSSPGQIALTLLGG